jgi:adenylate cyclase
VRLAFRVRLGALAVIGVWTALRIEPPTLYHYAWLIGLMGFLGWLQVGLARRHGRRARLLQALLIALDMAILAYALVVPPPGAPPEWTMAMQFRLGNFAYMLVFIALTALTYHPFMALWTAASAIAAWVAATLIALGQDGVYTILDLGRLQAMDAATLRATLLDPFYLSAVERAQEALLALVLAAIVALACGRARSLVRREVQSSVERANLARYFSPDLVGSLASGSARVGATARTDATILFVDIVGFTRFAERLPPEVVIDVLRGFHGRMAEAVFAHGGTLHKFLGDGLMASFGVTDGLVGGAGKAAPAARALDCLVAIQQGMADWNRDRVARGEAPLAVAIGLHHGPVVTGDVGDARCLEFAVIGDTVNVASRLEALCRPLEAAAIVSREAAVAAGAHPALAGFVAEAEAILIRGREAPVAILRLPSDTGL